MKKIILFLCLLCLSNQALAERYVLTLKLKLKQSHVSLDPITWLKDDLNATKFQIPVDKEFYDSVKVGQELVDDFRTGSLILTGSFGSWKISIDKKEVKP